MTRTLALGMVLIGAFVVCGLGWWLLPSLQDAQRRVDGEASVEVERARRLLDRYRPGLAYKSLLVEQLRELQVDVDLADPDVLLDDSVADEYQARHERAWETFEPTNRRGGVPTKAPPPNYGDLVRQGEEATRRRDELFAENTALLDEALESVKRALRLTRGGASADSHAEASRLKGVILYHKGLALRTQAGIRRCEAGPVRRRLTDLALHATALESSARLVAASGIEERISSLATAAASADASLDENRKTLATLDDTLEDIEDRLASARSRATEARKAMEATRAAGIDLSDPNGGEVFHAALIKQDRDYREALRQTQALEFGTYTVARIDGSADYLSGRYVENDSTEDLTIDFGLTHYRDRRRVLAGRIEAEQQAADDLRSDTARLEGIRDAYHTGQEQAVRKLREIRADADEVFAKLNRLESEAFAIEEQALALLEEAAADAGRAASSADRWASDAGARLQDLSPAAKRRSAYEQRADDRWMAGYTAAQVADARLAKAWIFCARYAASTASAQVLTDLAGPLRLAEADAGGERTKAQDAHDAGVEEVTRAVALLESVHAKVGEHWTIVAQEAGAIYLLALFGHESYVEEAIAAYRNALAGREDEEHVDRLRARLARLEHR